MFGETEMSGGHETDLVQKLDHFNRTIVDVVAHNLYSVLM